MVYLQYTNESYYLQVRYIIVSICRTYRKIETRPLCTDASKISGVPAGLATQGAGVYFPEAWLGSSMAISER